MSNEDEREPRASGGGSSLWSRLWRRPTRWYLLGIPAGAVLALLLGVVVTLAFQGTIHATSTQAFCTGCHSMQAFVVPEYEASIHGTNASGVAATCADCHLPKAFFPKMMRKMEAGLHEVPAHLTGKIDTREKYEAHRLELAERVWARMRASDSGTCKSCHLLEDMDLEAQDRYASRKHSPEYLEKTGRTCIDCHQGVAHELPEDMARAPAGGEHVTAMARTATGRVRDSADDAQ